MNDIKSQVCLGREILCLSGCLLHGSLILGKVLVFIEQSSQPQPRDLAFSGIAGTERDSKYSQTAARDNLQLRAKYRQPGAG